MAPGRHRGASRHRATGIAAALLLLGVRATGAVPLPADTVFTGGGSPDSASIRADTSEPIHATRLTIVAGTMAAAMIGIHLYQESGWWRYNRTPFHFREDLTYGRSVDKIGHFYGTGLWAYSLRNVLRWANVPDRSAMLLGSGGAFLFQTFVEVEDGFSAWGFDRVDFLCDLGGALWPVAQYHSEALRAVDLKLSYKPSSLLNRSSGEGFVGQKHLVMDDYEGQTFWLSVPPERILPEGAASIWPDFLRVAVGYGVRGVSDAWGGAYSVVFISLDYDMKNIIPQTSRFLVTLSEVLDFIHFPAPAIRLSPSTVLYGLYY